MKRVLFIAMMMACMLLSACMSAFHSFDNDELSAESEETTAVVQPTSTFGLIENGQEITLTLEFGERTGIYAGDMKDGLPHGNGTFSSKNSEGTGWVYEGSWDMGHMQGDGTTTFETGYVETGWYESDSLNGQGGTYQNGRPIYEGEFVMNTPNGQGTLYSYCGDVIYSGQFKDGFIDETEEASKARLSAFKQGCGTPEYDEMMKSAKNSDGLRVQVSGTVYYMYDMDASEYESSFILQLPDGGIVYVNLHLSTGETPIRMGKKATVWGIADYVYTYKTESGKQVAIPMIEAWDVTDISGTQL